MMRTPLFVCRWLCALGLLFIAPSALMAEQKPTAVQLESAAERHVRLIAGKLRCPVCQGESVYDSHADVAVEMKNLIAEKLAKGESEAEILAYFQARYGNFILMEPPAAGIHWMIWLFPALLGVIGLFLLFRVIGAARSSNKSDDTSGDKESDDIGALNL